VVWSACRISQPELLSSLSLIDAVASRRIVTCESSWIPCCRHSSHLRLSDATALCRAALIIGGASLFSYFNLCYWWSKIAIELELNATYVVWLTGNLRRDTYIGVESNVWCISCCSVCQSTAHSFLRACFTCSTCRTSSSYDCRSCNSCSTWLS